MAELVLYFDRCFGSKFPELVEKAKPPFKVEYHNRCGFKHDTPDDIWLESVGKNKWVVLSHDAKFHKESAALEAIRQHKVGCFYLWGAQLPVWNKFVLFAQSFEKIEKAVRTDRKPFIYRINSRAQLKRIEC